MTAVLVFGATGNVGATVVRELSGRGVRVCAFVRDPARAAGILGTDIEFAQGNLDDPAAIRHAFDGVDRVFLSSGDGPWKVQQQAHAIEAAAAAGVRRIVALSAAGAEAGSPLGLWDWQGQIEQRLRDSGVPAVTLRPCFFMSNVLASAEAIRQTGSLFAPAGDARIAMVDPRDVAAAAVTVLVEDGHDGEVYTLTGPEAITHTDIARCLSAAAGRPIAFVDLPDQAAREGMLQAGMPDWLVENLVTLFAISKHGGHPQEQPTDAVRLLTGREPRGFAEFARDHAQLFRG